MSDDSKENKCSPSTETSWIYEKIAVRPQGPAEEAPQEAFRRLPWREQRQTIHCMVTYRGGAACWWQIEARGRVFRVAGWEALHDVMASINSGERKGKAPVEGKGRSKRKPLN